VLLVCLSLALDSFNLIDNSGELLLLLLCFDQPLVFNIFFQLFDVSIIAIGLRLGKKDILIHANGTQFFTISSKLRFFVFDIKYAY